jgi:hypothetical protein
MPLSATILATPPSNAARILTGLEHFGRRFAFGERKVLLDDQRATQWHRKQHTEYAAESGDRQHP